MGRFSPAMKAFLVFLLVALFVSPASSYPSAYAAPGQGGAVGALALVDSSIIRSLGPQGLPSISQQARLKGIQPATLKNVQLRLKPGVTWLSEDQVGALKQHASSGKISASLLPGVEPGNIYVDPSSLTPLELVRGEGDTLYVLLADEERIVEEIDIPEQTVFLNEANITYHAEGISITPRKLKSGASVEGTGFEIAFDENYKLPGYDQEGKLVQVALSGRLNINAPAVEVKYTKNNGYRFVFTASETAQVQAELLAQLKKDVKIPIKEFTVPAQGCKVTVGIFLVMGVDGKITLQYSLEQGLFVRAGFEGSTRYYVPTSFDTIKEVDFDFTPGDVSLNADIKGELSVLAAVGFDILGKGKVNLDNKIGVLLEVKASGTGGSGDYLSVKGDGFLKISGKVKVKSFDKSKTVYEKKYPILSYTKARSTSYDIRIVRACAYSNLIQGAILDRRTGQPYAGKAIQLKVTSSSGTEKILSATTDSGGAFSRSFDLKQGDRVRVKIPDSTDLWSEPCEASFPFNHVVVEFAGYLSDTVRGYVSGPEDGSQAYNGPVSILVERSNNIPLHNQESLSLPVVYPIRLQAQSTNGVFQLQGVDVRPYDRVYALLESEGFTVASQKVETEGYEIIVAGDYLQEPHRLSSPGSSVIVSNLRTGSPFSGEVVYKVAVLFPHSSNPENSLKIREWRLNLSPTPGGQYSTAVTGAWELDLQGLAGLINSPLDRFRMSLAGSRSINYHVYETVELFTDGKLVRHFREARTCEVERGRGLAETIDRLGKALLSLNSGDYSSVMQTPAPLVGESPADYYLAGLEAVLEPAQGGTEGEGASSSLEVGPLSTKNFQVDVAARYFSSATAATPYLSRDFRLSVLGLQQKADYGARDYTMVWDRVARTKALIHNEYKSKETARYDLDDYIPELQNTGFTLKGGDNVNGVSCQVWEKSRKIDPLMNLYVKVQVCLASSSSLPVKAVFYDGYHQRIELLFSNYREAAASGSPAPGGGLRLFPPVFGEIRLPAFNLQVPSSTDDNPGESPQEVPSDTTPESPDGGLSGESGRGDSGGVPSGGRVTIALTIGNPFMRVNGEQVEIDPGRGTEPRIVDGRTILPIRAIVETLGGSITWDEGERKIAIVGRGATIEMWVGKREMLVNGAPITNDVAPAIINARTYVPVRFVAENLRCEVGWNEQARLVTIVAGD